MSHDEFMSWLGPINELISEPKKRKFIPKAEGFEKGDRVRLSNGLEVEVLGMVHDKDYIHSDRVRVALFTKGNPSVKGRGPNASRNSTKPKSLVVSLSECTPIG